MAMATARILKFICFMHQSFPHRLSGCLPAMRRSDLFFDSGIRVRRAQGRLEVGFLLFIPISFLTACASEDYYPSRPASVVKCTVNATDQKCGPGDRRKRASRSAAPMELDFICYR